MPKPPGHVKLTRRLATAANAVIRVGDGRGFVVQGRPLYAFPQMVEPLVLTAAHCLPRLPASAMLSYLHERTYAKLLGSLGAEPAVWAECFFVDPVADLAVLGPPDAQELYDEAAAYEALMDGITALRIAAPAPGPAWVLGLDGQWRSGTLARGGVLTLTGARVEGGMSGSPILQGQGAVGVVCSGQVDPEGAAAGWSRHPCLVRDLPGWMLRRGPARPGQRKPRAQGGMKR